jgi:hypothetical protein
LREASRRWVQSAGGMPNDRFGMPDDGFDDCMGGSAFSSDGNNDRLQLLRRFE